MIPQLSLSILEGMDEDETSAQAKLRSEKGDEMDSDERTALFVLLRRMSIQLVLPNFLSAKRGMQC